MAIYHFSAKIISRADGKSAVAAAAYRSGQRLFSTYDGKTSDYTRKKGVIHSEINLPVYAPNAFQDRETLWNAVEQRETRSNAQLAREIEIALPVEWTESQQISYMRSFIQETFVSAGMAADWAIHCPNETNPHIHILLTLRPFNADGSWGAKRKATYDLDQYGDRIPLIDPKTGSQKLYFNSVTKSKEVHPLKSWKRSYETLPWNSVTTLNTWRLAWCEFANERLPKDRQIDHRSYVDQGKTQIPTIHEGPAVAHSERREINEMIRTHNGKLAAMETMHTTLKNDNLEVPLPHMHPVSRPHTKTEAKKLIAQREGKKSDSGETELDQIIKILNILIVLLHQKQIDEEQLEQQYQKRKKLHHDLGPAFDILLKDPTTLDPVERLQRKVALYEKNQIEDLYDQYRDDDETLAEFWTRWQENPEDQRSHGGFSL